MLTLIFILALTLFCASLLLLGLTMKIKLPWYALTPEDFPSGPYSPETFRRKPVDLGNYTNNLSTPPGQAAPFVEAPKKGQLLLGYDQHSEVH